MPSVSRHCLCFSLIAISLFTIAPGGAAQDVKTERRSVTVSDAIRMTAWADKQYFAGGTPDDRVGIFSPDGLEFVVVVRRGNLEENTNEYSLLLFHNRNLFDNPRPEILLTMSSSSNREAIGNVKWLNDNKTVVFLGESLGTTPAVYSLDTKTKHLETLTHHATPIVAYDIGPNGERIVYEAVQQRTAPSITNATRRNGVVISTQNPSDLFRIECNSSEEFDGSDLELFVQHSPDTVTRVILSDALWEYLPLSISPNGRYAVLETYVADIPSSWSAYRDPLLHPYIIDPKKQGRRSNVTHYMLLDTRSGEIGPLLDAPISWFNNALVWAKDGSSLIVSGTYLPLNAVDPDARESRETRTFVAEIEVPSKSIITITDQPVRVSNWNQHAGILVLGPEDKMNSATKAYKKTGSSWNEVPLTAGTLERSNPLTVTLEEDNNTPPKILVMSEESRRKAVLFDLNPQFSNLMFGRVEAVTWTATDGHKVVGGLYYPPDYEIGKRYPLVIQTHGFQKDKFWIDGPWSSAFAAQPLAAKEIIVLQVGSSADPAENAKYSHTPEEAPRQMAAYEGAIDYLEGRGLIDRSRVGIIGFSRTVFYVAYTLTHSKYHFTAATLADGFDAGYVNLMLGGGMDDVAANGGLPFGPSLFSWMKNSPGFNLDKVNAAVRLEYYGRGGFLGGWQSFAGLTLLKKRVDFVWLPYGMHLLVKPWERLVSQQGNVDWFNFWLNGTDDPDPLKSAEYERWKKLRPAEARPQ